jgi:hypothetical protein
MRFAQFFAVAVPTLVLAGSAATLHGMYLTSFSLITP